MKAIRENILYTTESFTAYLFEGKSFNHPYHFHFENEIVLIYESHGKILVSDQMADYREGDIFILGSNMPHSFISDSDSEIAKSLVIQFNNSCFGEPFFQLPEFKTIRQLLEKSKYGLRIGNNKQFVGQMIENTCNATGVQSVISLINLLYEISQIENVDHILPDHSYVDASLETHKLNAAIDWIDTNYFRQIQLSDIANITNLTENAFCRCFKKATGKTFLQYLNDKRVHEAAKSLIETELSITQIAYEVGFSNISSFNRYFKKQKKISPSEFRKDVGAYSNQV
ncbi:AraC family transcriptional regulator [Alginatibacterium sediminis]|uniref:AraC family transcriptional regulator n=1 Tax=Alginatibacterium sediminis TaxID=2164068 RepID=A0A420E6B1_9ALTE|nr:AraC family transcriptional regulator [Alginatibacterium sediminis]RKF13689.1 AraC family transcriptional regulator [Alginatibacterium sediminis]